MKQLLPDLEAKQLYCEEANFEYEINNYGRNKSMGKT